MPAPDVAPNVLLITADDLGDETVGAFGGRPEVTPVLDRLAAEGMIFERAHVPIAVCQPSRSAIMTGRWPHRNGAEGFEPIRDGVPVLTELLRPAGYRCGILGKVDHLAPVERFGWDLIRTYEELTAGRDPQSYAMAAADFLAEAAAAGQPFFLMANAHDPHRPFAGSASEREAFGDELTARLPAPSRVFTPAEADLPGFLPDLPEVRRETAEYLSSSRRCDDVVGRLLSVLDESGQAANTVVIFLSDNGMAFPYAKANCYLQSTRTPLIIRWPGRVRPGSVDRRHFVSGLDLFPTICAAAGVGPVGGIDGRALDTLLAGGTEEGRDRIVTVFHETSAKRRYEMRCLQDADAGYLWNAWSDGTTEYRAENMSGASWPAMIDSASLLPDVADRVEFYRRRAVEEYYWFATDPCSLTNRIDDPDHAERVVRLRDQLRDWMISVDDPLTERFPG